MHGREATLAVVTRPRQSLAVRRTLEQSVHFREVAARDLERLAQLARSRRLHNDERVESAGGYDAHLWIVLSGAVRISTSAHKGEHVYAVLGPGNYFGLAAVIGKGVGTLAARAFGATELAWIDGAALMRLLDDRPALWRHFGALLSDRLMVALALLRDNTACALPERLVRRLLVLLPAIEAAPAGRAAERVGAPAPLSSPGNQGAPRGAGAADDAGRSRAHARDEPLARERG